MTPLPPDSRLAEVMRGDSTHTPLYEILRSLAFEHDGVTCRWCGKWDYENHLAERCDLKRALEALKGHP